MHIIAAFWFSATSASVNACRRCSRLQVIRTHLSNIRGSMVRQYVKTMETGKKADDPVDMRASTSYWNLALTCVVYQPPFRLRTRRTHFGSSVCVPFPHLRACTLRAGNVLNTESRLYKAQFIRSAFVARLRACEFCKNEDER